MKSRPAMPTKSFLLLASCILPLASCILLLASCILLLASSTSLAKPKERPFGEIIISSKIAECIEDNSPPVTEMHNRALRYARMTTADLSRWKKNIKWAAALPRLQFGYTRKIVDGVNVDIDDSVSVNSSGVVIGPTASGWAQSLDRNNNIEIKAVWYLDELLFNRDDLSISSEARSQISTRRNLLGEITDDYFELKRLISIYLMKTPEVDEFKGSIRLEIGRLTGRLNAITGGWFGSRFRWKEVRCD